MTRSITPLVALTALLFLLAGCQSVKTGLPVATSVDEAPQVTNMAEVFEAIGLPQSIQYGDGGERLLVYRYSESRGESLGLGHILLHWRWTHLQQGADRLEIRLNRANEVLGMQVFTQVGDIEPRLNPY